GRPSCPSLSFIHHITLLLVPITILIRLPLGIFVRFILRFFLRQDDLLLVLTVIGVGVAFVFLGLALSLLHLQPEVRPAAGNTGQHQKYQHKFGRTVLVLLGFRLRQRFGFRGGRR